MDKLKMQSIDMTEKNIEKIGALFPNVITEMKSEDGKLKKGIDFEKLKQELLDDVADGEESYDFTWVGKKAAIVEGNTPIRKTLRPCIEESKNWETTGNLYIEGDNLDVLKLLQESYLNSIKMIYIDPPYNTGNDFIYRDNFTIDKSEYEEQIGLYDEDENRLFRNTESNGRFHSDWCSMLYPRLKLSHNLLTEDGVIFISIDDNEFDNLKKICNEIYGEENFLGVFIKQSKVGGGSDTKFIVKEHEYCLVYSKSNNEVQEMFINHDEDYLKRYKEKDNFGRYFWDTFARPGLQLKTDESLNYEIKCPDGSIIKTRWIRSKGRFEKEYKDGIIRIIKKNNGEWSVQFKQYLNESGKKPRSMTMDFGGTIDGKNDIEEIFNNDKIFYYPKSSVFLKRLFEIIKDTSTIILDFFSGSATTAHAVMQLNSEDGGNRKFIMVNLPEACNEDSEAYKAGYKNICEIGKERIRRAGDKINEEILRNSKQLKMGEEEKKQVDIGFRVLKVDSTNMEDVYYAASQYDQQMLAELESNIKEDRTDLDLLYGVLLDWGLPLSLSHKIEQIDGIDVHTVDESSLIACFADKVSENVVREIAKRQPLRVVFKDSGFASSPEKINVEEIFKLLAPNTAVKVI